MAEQSLEGRGRKREKETHPLLVKPRAEMGYLKIGRDVKREGWVGVRVGEGDDGWCVCVGWGVLQERMKGLRHERKTDMG